VRLHSGTLEPVVTQFFERGFVVLPHPVQRVLTSDVFELEVRVVRHGSHRHGSGSVLYYTVDEDRGDS
jgi:hypothetical protein